MNDCIRLMCLGDCLCYGAQMGRLHALGKTYAETVAAAAPVVRGADYVLANLETPLAGEALGLARGAEPVFNAPTAFAEALKTLGVGFLSTANNHCLDRGVAGLEATIRNLDTLGLDHDGTFLTEADAGRVFVKEISGVRVAILCATYGTNSEYGRMCLPEGETWRVSLLRPQPPNPPPGRPWPLWRRAMRKVTPRRVREALSVLRHGLPRPPDLRPVPDNVPAGEVGAAAHEAYIRAFTEKIRRAKEVADFVVVMAHVGGQYNPAPGQYERATVRRIAEAGADLILAEHAHKPLCLERLPNGTWVSYALGNFTYTPGVGWFIPNVLAEYSVALHVWVSRADKSIARMSFSVLKSVVGADGVARTVPVPTLLGQLIDPEARELLVMENEAVVNQFRGTRGAVEVAEEYEAGCP